MCKNATKRDRATEQDRENLLSLMPAQFSQLDYQRKTQHWFFAIVVTTYGGIAYNHTVIRELLGNGTVLSIAGVVLILAAALIIYWFIRRHITFRMIDENIRDSCDLIFEKAKFIPQGLRKGKRRCGFCSFCGGVLPYILVIVVVACAAIAPFFSKDEALQAAGLKDSQEQVENK
jgi:hypothetical protein